MNQNSDEKVSWKEISPQYAHDYFSSWAFTTKQPPTKVGGFSAGRKGLKVHPIRSPRF
jgi:hypothetical protein